MAYSEQDVLDAIKDVLLELSVFNSDNVTITDYNILNHGISVGAIILDGTINSPVDAPVLPMGGSYTEYAPDIEIVVRYNDQVSALTELRDVVKIVRTAIDTARVLGGVADRSKATGVSEPRMIFSRGNGSGVRFVSRTISLSVEDIESNYPYV